MGMKSRKTSAISSVLSAPARFIIPSNVASASSIAGGRGTVPRLLPSAKNSTVCTIPSASLAGARIISSDGSRKTAPFGGLTILTSGGGLVRSAPKPLTLSNRIDNKPGQRGFLSLIKFLTFAIDGFGVARSEEHTSELQSH